VLVNKELPVEEANAIQAFARISLPQQPTSRHESAPQGANAALAFARLQGRQVSDPESTEGQMDAAGSAVGESSLDGQTAPGSEGLPPPNLD
jgi:hypothetical protein